jgi:hypothetical protein
MAAVSSSTFKYSRVEAVRDAMIMRRSTSDFVCGLICLRNLNLPSVKRSGKSNPFFRKGEEELTELFDRGVSMKDRLMEYGNSDFCWRERFNVNGNAWTIFCVVEASFGVKLDMAVLTTAVRAAKESLGLTMFYTEIEGSMVPDAPGMSPEEAGIARSVLCTACDQLAQTICVVLRESEPGFRLELERNETMRALFTAAACAVLLGREHINLCVSALLGVRQQFVPDQLMPLQLGAVEVCTFRGEVASVGHVLQDVLAANKNNDVVSAIVRAVLLGSQRPELLSSNGFIDFEEVPAAWDFPIVFELLAQNWYGITSGEGVAEEENGYWGGFSRLMNACLSVLHATGIEAHPNDQFHVGLTTAEKLAVVRKGGRFVAQYDWRFSVRTVDQPIRDRCWRNERARRKVSKAFSEWYSNNVGSEGIDAKLSELLSEADLTYQDYLKAALIVGDRGGVLSKENTCFAVETLEGPVNLTEALELETVAEEVFFTDGELRSNGGLGTVTSTTVRSFLAGEHELNVTMVGYDDYSTRLERGPPPGLSGDTKVGGRDNGKVRLTGLLPLVAVSQEFERVSL